MEPTLLVGDFLLVAKQGLGFDESTSVLPATTIHRGEIVIFHFPVDPAMHLIKRVVGLPGDHIRLRDNHVYINGRPLDEPYAIYHPGAPDPFRDNFPHLQSIDPDVTPAWWVQMHTLVDNGELIVPAGNYFVLGDNRNNSEDSRYWGLVPRANIVGTPVLIYFSLRQDEDRHDPTLAAKSLQPTTAPTQTPTRWIDSLRHLARWHRFFTIVR
jgi:signal peptidase I